MASDLIPGIFQTLFFLKFLNAAKRKTAVHTLCDIKINKSKVSWIGVYCCNASDPGDWMKHNEHSSRSRAPKSAKMPVLSGLCLLTALDELFFYLKLRSRKGLTYTCCGY